MSYLKDNEFHLSVADLISLFLSEIVLIVNYLKWVQSTVGGIIP